MADLVSVVIPVHNGEKYIRETVDSVLNQTYSDFEVILVNDGSTDNSLEIMNSIEDDRVIVITNENPGNAARARNAGVAVAKGRYLAYLDADDLWEPDKLKKSLEFMNKKDSAFVFTGYEFADENANGLGKIVNVPEQITYNEALSRTVIFTSTVLFDLNKISKELVKMPEVRSEDTATWWKILRSGYVANGLNENLVRYRRSGKTLSSNKLVAIKRIWFLYRKCEGLSFFKSCKCFVGWAFGAVARRI